MPEDGARTAAILRGRLLIWAGGPGINAGEGLPLQAALICRGSIEWEPATEAQMLIQALTLIEQKVSVGAFIGMQIHL